MNKDKSPIILAFSGGLDTSFCVPWLKEHYGRDVITACVDTGGIDAEAAVALEKRSKALGAIEHLLIDAKQEFFETVIRHLIAGNVPGISNSMNNCNHLNLLYRKQDKSAVQKAG